MNNGAAVTKKGRIWVTWIGGEDSDEAYTLAAWSDDGGTTWRNPALVVDGHGPVPRPRMPVSNIIANFWIDPQGVLHLFFSQSAWHNDGRMGVWEIACADPDAAWPEWTEPRRISDGAALNKPIVAKNGDWILPVEVARPYGCWEDWFRDGVGSSAIATTLCSRDEGRSWTRGGDMVVPDSFWPENHVLELADGKWRMYARSLVGLWCAESTDRGCTWSDAVKPKGMDMITARCQIRKLHSGTWIFIRHDGPVDSFYPSADDSHRDKIVLYASKDEGKTWEGGLIVDDSRFVSYPDLEEGPDGRLYVSHDFERQKGAEIRLHIVREADVWAGKIVSPDARLGILVTKARNSVRK